MLNDKELKELINAISDPEKKYWKGVLYGDFGKRKTSTGLRCSNRRAILLHADRGWNIVHNHPDEFPVPEKVIPVEYQGLTQTKAIVEAVTEEQEPFNDVDLIQLDTISQMQEKYLDFLGENFTIFGREKATPKPGSKEKEISLTGLPDYHLTRNKMRPVVDLLIQAPVNVLFLCHVRDPNAMEVQKGKLMRRPNVTEAVFNLLARDATFIGLMEAKRDEYTINFKPSATICAKSQIASLTDKIIKSEELPKYLNEWQGI